MSAFPDPAHARASPSALAPPLVATARATPLDLPAWCQMTGHDDLVPVPDPSGRPRTTPDGPGLSRAPEQRTAAREG